MLYGKIEGIVGGCNSTLLLEVEAEQEFGKVRQRKQPELGMR